MHLLSCYVKKACGTFTVVIPFIIDLEKKILQDKLPKMISDLQTIEVLKSQDSKTELSDINSLICMTRFLLRFA